MTTVGEGEGGDDLVLTRSEEELRVDVERREAGRVRVRKEIERERVEEVVPLGVDHVEVERLAADPATDSGEVETLEDGSLSIPVFAEELVVETRQVVRERVIVRTRRRVEERTIEADLARERIVVEPVPPAAD